LSKPNITLVIDAIGEYPVIRLGFDFEQTLIRKIKHIKILFSRFTNAKAEIYEIPYIHTLHDFINHPPYCFIPDIFIFFLFVSVSFITFGGTIYKILIRYAQFYKK